MFFLVSGFCCIVVLSFCCFWWLIGRHVQTWATKIFRHGYRFCSTCRHGQPVCVTCRHGQPVCRTRQLGCANACVSGALVRCAVCRRCAARAERTGQARNGSGRLTWGRVPRGPCPEDPIFRKVPRSFFADTVSMEVARADRPEEQRTGQGSTRREHAASRLACESARGTHQLLDQGHPGRHTD